MPHLQLTGKRGTLHEQSTRRMKAQDQLLKMELQKPIPTEDAPNEILSKKEIVREKKELKTRPSEKRKAAVPEAMQAVQETAKQQRVEPVDGCPAPDPLVHLQTLFTTKFSQIEKQLSDFTRQYPVQAVQSNVKQVARGELQTNGYNTVQQVQQEPVFTFQSGGAVQGYVPENKALLAELAELKERMKTMDQTEFKAVEIVKPKKKRENWTMMF